MSEQKNDKFTQVVEAFPKSIAVPMQPSKSMEYLRYVCDTHMIEGNKEGAGIVGYDVSSINGGDPANAVVTFKGSEDTKEIEVAVLSNLSKRLTFVQTIDVFDKELEDEGKLLTRLKNDFMYYDVQPENVSVTIDKANATIGYVDGTIVKAIPLNIIDTTTNDGDMGVLLDASFDSLLLEELKEKGVTSSEGEKIKSLANTLLDDLGLDDVKILDIVPSYQFVILPISYTFNETRVRYNTIVLKELLDGSKWYESDANNDGAIPPEHVEAPSNRFAISLLSRDRAVAAMNEEMMVEKSTGQTLIADLEGHVVSYDKLSRQKMFQRHAIDDARMRSVTGDVLRFQPKDVVMPTTLVDGQQLTVDPIRLTKVKRALINLDIDTILLSKDSKLASEPSTVRLTYTLDGEEHVEEHSSERSILLTFKEEADVVIQSITVTPNPLYIDMDTRIVVHDIIIVK